MIRFWFLTRRSKVSIIRYNMEPIKKLDFVRVFRERGIKLFRNGDVMKVFGVGNLTARSMIQRWAKAEIIELLAKGKYRFLLANNEAGEFEVANFIYQPSYVSLETVLSMEGIIDQFPYKVISITTRKSKMIKIGPKEYQYFRVKPSLFVDYELIDGYLRARRMKAIFDYLYLAYKGSVSQNNIDLMNLTREMKNGFLKYVIEELKYDDSKFRSFVRRKWNVD